jgi:hypothetical protein
VEKYGKVRQAHMKILRVRIACWIPKATNTLSECVILVASLLQQWLHEHTSVLRLMFVACLVTFKSYRIYLSVLRVPCDCLKDQLLVHNLLQIETTCVLCEVGRNIRILNKLMRVFGLAMTQAVIRRPLTAEAWV